MFTISIILLSLFVALGFFVANRSKIFTKSTDKYNSVVTKFNPSGLVTPILILIVGLIVGILQPFKLERIDAGHIGLKVNLTGDNRGVSDYQYKTGWVTFNTWTESLYEFPTYQQHIEYDSVNVITKGGFSATIKPSFNYNIISTAVGDMFVNLRVDIKQVEQGWLKTAIIGSVNDVANKWAVDDIFNQREQFESAIIVECNKRVAKWFLVSQLRTNITPPPSLQKAINDKTKAIQEAQGEVQKALVADAQAKVKIANAKGDSAQAVIIASGRAQAAVITANGEAEAMKAKQRELSQLYIDYIRATGWDGKYPTTILGGNTSTLFQMK